jgi:hypothetical protein
MARLLVVARALYRSRRPVSTPAALDHAPPRREADGLAMIIRIEDPLDPRIAAFREVKERDLAGRRGGFIAEGEVVLNVLARGRRHRARALLIAETRVERLAPLIERRGADRRGGLARRGRGARRGALRYFQP